MERWAPFTLEWPGLAAPGPTPLTLRLLVDRPPRTIAAAQRIAAEQIGLADECMEAGQGIAPITARLVNAPIWTFWWD
jgi:hypothetical protein